MRFKILHRTTYAYDSEVTTSHSEAHLVPRSLPGQSCLASDLVIDPAPTDYRERFDYFGNRASYFSLHRPHRSLRVAATSIVEVADSAADPTDTLPGLADPGPSWEEARRRLYSEPDPDVLTARQFTIDSPLVTTSAALAAYARPSFPPGRPLVEAILDLSSRINDDYAYVPGATTIATRLDEVLDRRKGVCQDFAHLAIGCVRSLGLPARYVSGYLETDPPPGRERLLGADASHAWLSVHVPEHGWLDIDPTNDQRPSGRHITTAWGRDYSDVTPLKGVVFSTGGHHSLEVAVDVVAIS